MDLIKSKTSNRDATPSNPKSMDLGAFFEDIIPDYEAGDRYEVAVVKENGVRLVYKFRPTSDHRIVLESVSYSGMVEENK
jgi:hypothetical protein